mgnify:CR=1 FL=1
MAQDISTARILIRPFHVTNTFALMAALAFTAIHSGGGISPRELLAVTVAMLASSAFAASACDSSRASRASRTASRISSSVWKSLSKGIGRRRYGAGRG